LKTDLLENFDEALRGDVCFVRLAEEIQAAGHPGAILAGTTPERWVEEIARRAPETVVFLDAVEIPGEPGSVIFVDAPGLKSRYPQISTHKLSLGTLAAVLEARARSRVWLLGVKPLSLAPAAGLTPPVRATMKVLMTLLKDALPARAREGRGGSLAAGSRPQLSISAGSFGRRL
jgi:hydrogenase maturation protease